jgi:hypothetical protein
LLTSLPIDTSANFLETAGVFSKFEFPAHASGADETLVSFGIRSNRRRQKVARCGGITLYQVAELIVISTCWLQRYAATSDEALHNYPATHFGRNPANQYNPIPPLEAKRS